MARRQLGYHVRTSCNIAVFRRLSLCFLEGYGRGGQYACSAILPPRGAPFLPSGFDSRASNVSAGLEHVLPDKKTAVTESRLPAK